MMVKHFHKHGDFHVDIVLDGMHFVLFCGKKLVSYKREVMLCKALVMICDKLRVCGKF